MPHAMGYSHGPWPDLSMSMRCVWPDNLLALLHVLVGECDGCPGPRPQGPLLAMSHVPLVISIVDQVVDY